MFYTASQMFWNWHDRVIMWHSGSLVSNQEERQTVTINKDSDENTVLLEESELQVNPV